MAKGLGLRGFVPGRDAGDDDVASAAAVDRAQRAPAPAAVTPSGIPVAPVSGFASAIDSMFAQARAMAPDGGGVAAAPAAAAAAPVTPLDAAAGGQAPAARVATTAIPGILDPKQMAAHASKFVGGPVDSHTLGVTDPGIHNVEDFVAHNSHLTPLDIQILQAGKMTPHDQMLKQTMDIQNSMRQQALAEALGTPTTPEQKAVNAANALQRRQNMQVLSTAFAGAAVPGEMKDDLRARAAANARGMKD